MDYCTITDIETHISTAALTQLTSDEGNEIDLVVAEEAIIYASTLINGYLRGRYELPLNTRFPLLRIIAMDIAVYRLYSRRMRTDVPEIISQQYKDAIKMLQNIQKGVITLEVLSEELTANKIKAGDYKTNKQYLDRIFSKTKLNEY